MISLQPLSFFKEKRKKKIAISCSMQFSKYFFATSLLERSNSSNSVPLINDDEKDFGKQGIYAVPDLQLGSLYNYKNHNNSNNNK